MSRTPIWRRYLRLLGPDVAADVDDELQFHLDMTTNELVQKGWSPESARQEAVRLFGDVRQISHECFRLGRRRLRASQRSSFYAELRRDVEFALRMAARRRAHSSVIVVSLALGIGLTIAGFTVLKSIYLDTLPVHRPGELVLFKWTAEDWPGLFKLSGSVRDTEAGGVMSTSFSYAAYRRFAKHEDIFSSVFAFAPMRRININLGGEALLASGQMVSGSYFPGLEIVPRLGRLLGPGDDRGDSDPTVVLSHEFWARKLGSDPEVLGRQVNLNGFPFTVVGVAPEGFHGTLQIGDEPSIYVPLAHYQKDPRRGTALEDAAFWFLRVMARLQPGVDSAEALSTVAPTLKFSVQEDLGVDVGPDGRFSRPAPELALVSGARALDERRADVAGPLTAVVGVTLLVLVIACTNAAALFVAGTVARRREIGIRIALGAGRVRLVRQLLTETVVLAFAGGILGLLLSLWISRWLVSLMAGEVGSSLVLDLRPDLWVLIFAFVISALTGLVFGIAPALKMMRVQPVQNLRHDGLRSGRSRSGIRLGKWLVAAQVALSLVMLVTAGLFVRTVGNLLSVDTGVVPEGVFLFRVDPTLNGYEPDPMDTLCTGIADRIGGLPGIDQVTFSTFSLFSGSGSWDRLTVSEDQRVGTFVGVVDPGFLRTMQIPLLQGRDLRPGDLPETPLVAIVNQTFARRAFGNENAVGREISSGSGENRTVFRIVGVFRDGNRVSLHDEPEATAYISYKQAMGRFSQSSVTFYVRAVGHSSGVPGAVRAAVSGVDPDLPIFEMKLLSEQIADAIAPEKNFLVLSSVGSVFALVLCCVGLFGTVSYSLSRRLREIGIRISLGASRRGILLSALRELDTVVVGVVVGLGAALLAARGIDDLLFKTAPYDPIAMVLAAAVMLSVGVLTVFVPARRATRVDPVEVLRAE